jgi:hypothetical protein
MKNFAKRTLSRVLGPDFDAAVNEYHEQIERADVARAAEQSAREEAAWIGNTGLSEELERELPRYLRREFGETYGDEGTLKAADLEYLGAFPETDSNVHYWRIHDSSQESYAYIEIDSSGESFTGYGDKWPPGIERPKAELPTIRERILSFPMVVLGTVIVALVIVVTYPFAVIRRFTRRGR